MKITKIEPQKNNPDRVNIFADGSFFCGLDINLISELSLKENTELTDELRVRLQKEVLLSKCMRKAFSLLNYRDRTSFEMKRKLKENLFDANEIETTVAKLVSEGYINDDNFISEYITYHKDELSKSKIIQNLWKLGVPNDIITAYISKIYSEDDEYMSCLNAIKNKTRYSHCEKDKLIRHLLYKGYKYDTVLKAVNSGD